MEQEQRNKRLRC